MAWVRVTLLSGCAPILQRGAATVRKRTKKRAVVYWRQLWKGGKVWTIDISPIFFISRAFGAQLYGIVSYWTQFANAF